jgi:uncharacterized protein (TIGR00725 family)
VPHPVISVFGSSRCAEDSDLYRLARELGCALAQAGFAIASGGYGGVMEAVSRGAADGGGRVIAVVAKAFSSKANHWVQEKVVVERWEQRLQKLIALGDGYVACGGGTGTLAELAVAWEMMNKGLLERRPLVALGEFWRPVVERVASAEKDPRTAELVCLADSIPAALEALQRQLMEKR